MKSLVGNLDIIDKDIIEVLLRVERSLEIVKNLITKKEFDKSLYGECKIIEEEVDELELTIDELVINSIARFQPAASNLRYLVKVQELTTDLERISDLTVGIGKRIKGLYKEGLGENKDITYLSELIDKVIYIFRLFKDAFIEKKIDNTYLILGLDEEIDELRDQSIKVAVEKIYEDKELTLIGVNNIIIAQKIERIADLIENLAESYIYISKGEDIRHQN